MSMHNEYRQTNVRNFPHTPIGIQEPTSTSSTGTTTTGTTTTDQLCQNNPLVRLSVEAIREKYMICIGRPMPPSIHRTLLLDLIDGGHYQYYSYALDEAAMAPQPSWRYVMAIVRRLYREEVPPDSLLPY